MSGHGRRSLGAIPKNTPVKGYRVECVQTGSGARPSPRNVAAVRESLNRSCPTRSNSTPRGTPGRQAPRSTPRKTKTPQRRHTSYELVPSDTFGQEDDDEEVHVVPPRTQAEIEADELQKRIDEEKDREWLEIRERGAAVMRRAAETLKASRAISEQLRQRNLLKDVSCDSNSPSSAVCGDSDDDTVTVPIVDAPGSPPRELVIPASVYEDAQDGIVTVVATTGQESPIRSRSPSPQRQVQHQSPIRSRSPSPQRQVQTQSPIRVLTPPPVEMSPMMQFITPPQYSPRGRNEDQSSYFQVVAVPILDTDIPDHISMVEPVFGQQSQFRRSPVGGHRARVPHIMDMPNPGDIPDFVFGEQVESPVIGHFTMVDEYGNRQTMAALGTEECLHVAELVYVDPAQEPDCRRALRF